MEYKMYLKVSVKFNSNKKYDYLAHLGTEYEKGDIVFVPTKFGSKLAKVVNVKPILENNIDKNIEYKFLDGSIDEKGKKWYQKWWGILSFLLFFPGAMLVLVHQSKTSKLVKNIVSSILIIWLFLIFQSILK